MNELEVCEGRMKVTLTWHWRGRDLHVHVGGGQDHIGAVALVGRQADGQSCEASLCLSPHKEEALAVRAARALHEATGATVCVTAGIHLDDITADEIAMVLQTVEDGIARLIQQVGR